MLLSVCVRERERCFFVLLKSGKMIFRLYKYFSAVGKNCRAVDKQCQLSRFALILKHLGKFGSFADKICFRKLIFPN